MTSDNDELIFQGKRLQDCTKEQLLDVINRIFKGHLDMIKYNADHETKKLRIENNLLKEIINGRR